MSTDGAPTLERTDGEKKLKVTYLQYTSIIPRMEDGGGDGCSLLSPPLGTLLIYHEYLLIVKGRQICQGGMNSSNNNRSFNNKKLVHARYLTTIFHPALMNFGALDSKKRLIFQYLPFLKQQMK